ncbi:hypothetical protein DN402_19465 [Streptomyces sp. SW4]|nr:hypothetical protein DN402_19465 [Streptomyces sp. SW4]
MRPRSFEAPSSARSALALSVAAVITGAALFGALVPEASAAPLPLPSAGVERLVTEGVSVEGPLVNNLTLP